MLFRLTYSITSMHVQRGDSLPVVVEIDAQRHIKLWMRETKHEGKIVKQLCCDATLSTTPNKEISSDLKVLARGQLPLDSPPQVQLPYSTPSQPQLVDKDGMIANGWLVPFELLPHRLVDFGRVTASELSKLLKTFVRTLRWRERVSGKHNPFAHVGFEWSEDGIVWHTFPSEYSVDAWSAEGIDAREQSLRRVAELVIANEAEPIAHELAREAFGLFSSSPRSALLIAASAVETGVKGYIGGLVPETVPLLEKLQSPSVVVLLQEVIPELHKRKGHPSKALPLSRGAEAYLKKWISRRNQIAHGRKTALVSKDLREFITFAIQLLYLLDRERGHDWATAYIDSPLLSFQR